MIRSLLRVAPGLYQQTRNTWIFKRKNTPVIKADWENPLVVGPALKTINPDPELHPDDDFLYEVVDNTETKGEEPIKVILLEHVKGLGVAGDIVMVRPGKLRWDLILKHQATYASPENLRVYRHVIENRQYDTTAPSSAMSAHTKEKLSKLHLAMVMSITEPWKIEKWHVRASFRKAGWWVPDYAIELPEEPITGPDVEGKQGKDFAIFVTINKNPNERVPVRCVIHHWTYPRERYWRRKKIRMAILESQKELLSSMYTYEPVEEEEDFET